MSFATGVIRLAATPRLTATCMDLLWVLLIDLAENPGAALSRAFQTPGVLGDMVTTDRSATGDPVRDGSVKSFASSNDDDDDDGVRRCRRAMRLLSSLACC